MQGVTLRLMAILLSLLLVGMLLVNFVLIIFWKHDAVHRIVVQDQVVLERIREQLPVDPARLREVSPDFFSFADFYPPGDTGHIVLSTGNETSFSLQNSDALLSLLHRALTEARHTGKAVSHSSSSLTGIVGFRNNYVVTAVPVLCCNRIIGSVGIVRSLKPVVQALWQAEKTILGYILINLVVLGGIGFFRMTRIVVRPVERLVQLADQYQDQDAVLFSDDSLSCEFGRLSHSLNSMLARIEHDRKSLEETVQELAAANRQLTAHQQEMIRTEKLASVGRMAAGLAHEIGNPLGVVQGYLGLLGRRSGQSEEHLDYIRRAEGELQRVNTLIRRMLDFARVTKGEPELIKLHELLCSVVEMVEVQPVFERIELRCRLDADRDTVYADQDQLRQVFVNCLFNSADAVQAAPREGSGMITLSTQTQTVESEENALLILIRISDNGIGIAEDQSAVIFDPFYTTKEPGKGTGLGLSVSLSIIESAGGTMTMESSEGQGSVLSVVLPLFQGEQ